MTDKGQRTSVNTRRRKHYSFTTKFLTFSHRATGNKVRCARTNAWDLTRFGRKAKANDLCRANFVCSAPRVNASRAAGCLGCIPTPSGAATAEGTSARYAASRSAQPRWNSKFRSLRTVVGMPNTGIPCPQLLSSSTSRATPSGNENAPTTRALLVVKMRIEVTLVP